MLLFDTDLSLGTPLAEIDDGIALFFLHHWLKERVVGVTTVHGNVTLPEVEANSRRLLNCLKWNIPLGEGAINPLVEKKNWFQEWQAGYGNTPPWPDQTPLPGAVDLMMKTIFSHPGQVTLLAVGPLTNLALLARTYPAVVPLVKQIVAMGASFELDPRQAEFNIRCDPEAAHIVFTAGWPVRLIGLNITDQVRITRAEIAALPAGHPGLDLLKKQAPGWIERLETMGWGHNDCAPHDAVAAAAVLQPDLFEWRQTGVEVILWPEGKRGQTRFRPIGADFPQIEVAVDIQAGPCRTLILESLTHLANSR